MGKLANKRPARKSTVRKTAPKRPKRALPDVRKFAGAVPGMRILIDRRSELLERIEAVNDETILAALERTLDGASHYALSEEQLAALDASRERYLRGEAKTYTPEEVRKRAMKAIGA